MDDRLKIADRVTLLPDGPDRVYAHSWTQPLSLVGRANRILPELIPLLDGSRTGGEIVAALDGYGADAVAAVIRDLVSAGIVEPADPADGQRTAAERAQVAFFSQFALPPEFTETPTSRGLARTGAEYQARLAEARIAVLGAGRIGARLVQGLAASGARHLTVLDPAAVGADDIRGEAPYTACDLGAPRAEALRGHCAAAAPGLSLQPVVEPAEEAVLERTLAASSFAVVCPDAHDPGLLERVNRLALAQRLPWTSARALGLEFRIGPTILPGETACHTCLMLRVASNAPSEREHRLVEDWQRTGRLKPVGLALTPGVDLLVLEVVKAVTWFTAPACYGHLYTLDLVTMGGRRHPVLRIPRCPDCGRPASGRPTINAWQQSPPEAAP
jgi:bacteriocin biosynthesis cyclodehydratase domain-containing protein